MKQPFARQPENSEKATLLSVLANEQDYVALESIVTAFRWTVRRASGCREARNILRRTNVSVVLCDQNLPDGSWKQMLREIAGLKNAPILIVASTLADEALWAEVLNLGGYDLLSKPFRADEVLRTITSAPHLSLAATS
ncbi:MAG TPA: response regulator [Bryobacteraceae bacterium]|nr:response regulator [Bryobacteraceae bacterium]